MTDQQTERLTPHQLNERLVRLLGWKRRRGGNWEWGMEPKERVYAGAPTPSERNVPEAPPERFNHRSYSRIPAYIYDIALAWELVRLMQDDGANFRDVLRCIDSASTAPLVICQAFYEWRTGQPIEIVGPEGEAQVLEGEPPTP